MSNLSASSAHLAAISNDPLEQGGAAGLDEVNRSRDWSHGDTSWRGGARRSVGASSLQSIANADALRPALLAGAIGLFAAWVVSGMAQKQARRPRTLNALGRSSYVADREEPRGYRQIQGVGPEGASSPRDEELDALNP